VQRDTLDWAGLISIGLAVLALAAFLLVGE